jgi:hypothetical protein
VSDLDTARAEIVTALGAVLPGRVYAHPPTSGRAVTPSIYVEQALIGGEMDEPVATFPVWVVADGAIESQIEAHDGLVWNTWLALYPLASRIVARPMQVAGLRATVVEAEITLDVFGLCGAPAPTAHTHNGKEPRHADR